MMTIHVTYQYLVVLQILFGIIIAGTIFDANVPGDEKSLVLYTLTDHD